MDTSPLPNSGLATALSWTSLIIGLLFVAFLAWYVPTDRATYLEVFKEFNMELPASTEVMLAIPGVAFPALAIFCALGMIAVQACSSSKNAAAVFHILMIALCCAALVAYRETIAQPLTALIRNLSR